MIECEVLGEKKYSSVKKEMSGGRIECSWNEHIFFEPRNVVRRKISLLKLIVL